MSGGAVVTYNDARRFGYMTLIDADRLTEHDFFAGLGVEPLGDELTGDLPGGQGARPQARSQGVPDGPAHRRGSRQHLRLRGAVPRPPRSVQGRVAAGHQDRQANSARRAPGGRDQGGAARCDPRRWLDAARLQAGGWQHRLLPEGIRRLRPRRRALQSAAAAGASCGARRRAGARPSSVPPASADVPSAHVESPGNQWSTPWPTRPSSPRPRAASA